MTQRDAYDVVVARPPEPEEPPDPQAVARAARQALFTQEHEIRVWETPVNSRGSRQRQPSAPEETSTMEAQAAACTARTTSAQTATRMRSSPR
jgi:hypothetical protein